MYQRGKLILHLFLLIVSLFFIFYFLNDIRITGYAVSREQPPSSDREEVIEFGFEEFYRNKIDPEIFEAFNRGESPEVIVNTFPKSAVKEEHFRGKQVVRFSEDSLLTKFTKAELLKLAEDPAVEYIEPERYFNADLADAVSITRASTAWTRRVNGTNL